MKKILLAISGTIITLPIVLILSVLIANHVIEHSTSNKVFSDVESLPYNRVGLLLGTAKYVRSGHINEYFTNRINAAVKIYNAGKIDFIVVSGDNSRKDYNEPLDMKNALIKAGIPEDVIFADYAGFRTFDSVVRINSIFGQSRITIISQKWHTKRALYIAERKNIDAVGFSARDVPRYTGRNMKTREMLARFKVFIDILTGKDARFHGEPVKIPI
ncbi:SanA protein [Chitinispirillum alkaliphilum]|nr:SanA protein [Chitinispirillum alkaliphilum]